MVILSTIALLLFAGLVDKSLAQTVNYNGCYYSYRIPATGQQYEISRSYAAGQSCGYLLQTDPGSQIILQCLQNTPTSTNCAGDRIDVNRAGYQQLGLDQRYCGTQSFVTNSYTNKLAFSQISPTGFNPSNGGSMRCRASAQPGCDCGRGTLARIVGGTQAAAGESTSSGVLYGPDGANCGLTLVSPQTAVTAAHCVNSDIYNYQAIFGANNLATDLNSPLVERLNIASAVRHPQYNEDTHVNDIAVINFDRPVRYNQNIGPACLNPSPTVNTYFGRPVTAYGYGTSSFGGPKRNILWKAALNVVSTDQCNAIGGSRGISAGPNQFCTQRNGVDTCQNDSGGGSFARNPNTGLIELIGITSYGYACAVTGIPSVSTYAPNYISNFIKPQSVNGQYCF